MSVPDAEAPYDAGPLCPTNTRQVSFCNGDPLWSLCQTTLTPEPAACSGLDRSTQAWRDCISPPAAGCTLQIGQILIACVATCQ